MVGPVILLLAAYVFFVNAMYLEGKTEARGAGVTNILVGIIMGIAALYMGITSPDLATMTICTLSITFTLFYLLLGWGLIKGHNLKEVGYYSLYAGVWCLLCSYYFFNSIDWRFGGLSLLWGILFLSCYGLMAGERPLNRLVSRLLIGESILMVGTVYMMITGTW